MNWETCGLFPLDDMQRQTYLLGEARFSPTRRAKGWDFILGIGCDCGDLIGNNFGAQLTIRKQLRLK